MFNLVYDNTLWRMFEAEAAKRGYETGSGREEIGR